MRLTGIATVIVCFFALMLRADDAPPAAVKHPIMFFEYGNTQNRFVQLDGDGKITREFKPASIAVHFQVLANGNLLYGYGGSPTGVMEVNPKGETVWNYVSKCHQIFFSERLEDGNTLVAEQGPCQAVEVNPKGEIVHATPLTTNQEAFHQQVRGVHKLKNGNILAAHEGEGAVREYEPDGKVVWEMKDVTLTGDALRLENGNTLIGCGNGNRVIEVTPEGKTVWSVDQKELPGITLAWVTMLEVLPSGNIIIGNCHAGSENPQLIEVTREKKVVWTLKDHKNLGNSTAASVILGVDGKVIR